MAIGKISGPLLKENLLRDGIDLAFETDLLYLDVTNKRVGIKTTSPSHDFTVNGTARATNLEITNSADIGDITISGNQIYSNTSILNLSPAVGSHVVYQNKLIAGGIQIDGNNISVSSPINGDLNITASGTGSVRINSDALVNGNLHATGTITADGDIQLGDNDTDSITINADIASNIIPNVHDTYSLGTSSKRWADVWVQNLQAESVTTGAFDIGGIDITLRQGNIYYVALNGADGNSGTHQNDPLSSIGRALDLATAGDTVYIYPGTYSETLPLVVPTGVTVKGAGIRSVIIQPDSDVTVDIFLLNGETTIEDLTITGFEYDVGTNTGYAFRFAPNMIVSTRSPYIRNVSVITAGSTVRLMTNPPTDPRGFLSGDAGKGAYIDGSIVNSSSNQATMLFHSVTFICPGVDAITAINGVRIEWLNCFTYFANRGLYLQSGSSGFAGNGKTRLKVYGISAQTLVIGDTITVENVSANPATDTTGTIESFSYDSPYTNIVIDGKVSGFEQSLAIPDTSNQQIITFSGGQTASHLAWADYSEFGVELRSIGSACVYGNYGAYGDGEGVIAYLIGTNFAYIGNGKETTNDPNTVVQVNEVVELNRAQIYYTSVDARGDFRVGDFFVVDQETGTITFNPASLEINSAAGVTFTDGVNTTIINPTKIETGNIRISGNTIESTSGGITLLASDNDVTAQSDLTVTGTLTVDNNVTISGNTTIGNTNSDTVAINARLTTNLIPSTGGTKDLGELSAPWRNIFVSNVSTDSIEISGNVIQTTVSNADLELRANGTGNVIIPSDNLTVGQGLTVTSGVTNLKNTSVVGTLSTNTIISNTITTASLSTESILVSGNVIQTTVSNADLELRANGTGNVLIPSDNLTVNQNLSVTSGTSSFNNANVSGTLTVNNLVTNSTITFSTFSTSDIQIAGNVIRTTLSNSNLELRANGTGYVIAENLQFNGSTIVGTAAQDITLTPSGTGIVSINSTQALKIPTGTEIQRPGTPQAGMIRFNTFVNQFEGYNGSQWIQLGGVSDVDRNTYIVPESSPGANDNTLYFYANGNLSATMTSSYFDVNKLSVDQIEINDNIISTNVSGIDLELKPNGTGVVVFDNFKIGNNVILNTTSGAVTEFVSTDDGYYHIVGTGAVVIPSGATGSRPLVPALGMMRYNTEFQIVEIYDGTSWVSVAGAASGINAAQAEDIALTSALIFG